MELVAGEYFLYIFLWNFPYRRILAMLSWIFVYHTIWKIDLPKNSKYISHFSILKFWFCDKFTSLKIGIILYFYHSQLMVLLIKPNVSVMVDGKSWCLFNVCYGWWEIKIIFQNICSAIKYWRILSWLSFVLTIAPCY